MTEQPHILIVDDDREIRGLVARYLIEHGFRARAVADGQQMQKELADWSFDLVILDLMLPGEDGLALCRRLRVQTDLPIIMLTAMGEETDRIVGLEMGADDYVSKPFNPRELLARIKAVLRRTTSSRDSTTSNATSPGKYRFADWQFDLKTRELTSPKKMLIPLSAGEHDLLAAFVTHPQRVLSRDQLLDLARGRGSQPFDRSIDVQVSRLRRKIEADPANPVLIKTVRSGGYMFTPDIEAAS